MRRSVLKHQTVVVSIAVFAFMMSIAPTAAFALPSESLPPASPKFSREAARVTIVNALATPLARLHLRVAGMSQTDLNERLAALDDGQLAGIAEHAYEVRVAGHAGHVGAAVGAVVAVLIAVLWLFSRRSSIDDFEARLPQHLTREGLFTVKL